MKDKVEDLILLIQTLLRNIHSIFNCMYYFAQLFYSDNASNQCVQSLFTKWLGNLIIFHSPTKFKDYIVSAEKWLLINYVMID